jgi:hypothetical protein
LWSLCLAVAVDEEWSDIRHRKAFFDALAHWKGFNPLETERWNEITMEDVISRKVNLQSLSMERRHAN